MRNVDVEGTETQEYRWKHPERLRVSRTTKERTTFADKIHVTLVAVYVAGAGIYWAPGVSHTALAIGKYAIFGALFLVGLLRVKKMTAEQTPVAQGLIGCAVAVLGVTAITSELHVAVDQSRDFVQPLLWLIALLGLQPRVYPALASALTVTMSLFFVLSLYPVGAYIGVLPNLSPPETFIDPTGMKDRDEWTVEASSVISGGFTGSRTSWGVIVALSALFTTSLYMRERGLPATAVLFGAAAVIAGSLASIVITGARGGSMALVAVLAYSLASARGLRPSTISLAFGVVLLALSMDLVSLLPENFFRGFDSDGDLLSRANAASTGRLKTYLGALSSFAASPLVGVGPDAARVWISHFEQVEVHNAWLRILAESGLVVLLPTIGLTYRLTKLALSRASAPLVLPDARLVVLCGLVLGLAEPHVIFGAFNANAVFWTAVWIAIASERTQAASPQKARTFATGLRRDGYR